MIQIKKTILTLALLALTAQAWAQTETLLTTITATGTEQASYSTANVATVSFSNLPDNSSHYSDPWGWWGYGFTATVTAAEGYTITKCVFYDNDGASATDSTDPFIVETEEQNKKPKVNGATFGAFTSAGIKMIEVYGYVTPTAASGPEVDWNKTSKTGTFDMPGGNVELEPEYYPQAALTAKPTPAEGAKATTDDLLVSGGTVATITGSNPAAPQGTLMYYVSTTTMTTEALLALDADQWVAEPTAAGITQKCGAFVYYYVKGNESTDDALNFSDGDISSDNVLQVAIYPAPTYAVTFADDLAEPTLWTADPNTDVTKGQTVTVTYTGSKKVIGVKAEKGGGEPVLLTTITAADNSSFKSGSQTFGDVATVTLTGDYLTNDGSHGGWYCLGSNLTATISVAAANGANITSVKFYTAGGGSAEDKDAPFEVTTTSMSSSNITTYLNGNSIGSYGVSKIEVYGTK